MLQDRSKVWGFTLFGDDVRQEVGGKVSLMGLYQGDMIFHGPTSFPFVVSKFAAVIFYYEMRDQIDTDIVFRVTYDNDQNLIAEAMLSRKDLKLDASVGSSLDDAENSERIFHARLPIIMSPLPLEKAGWLRVRAHYSDGKILRLGSIHIKHMSTEDFLAMQQRNEGAAAAKARGG